MTFPPPTPWKPRATVDPAREYVAFTSAFHLKSFRRVPAFMCRSLKIMKQVDAAPGIVGWSLGANVLKREFYTLSVWRDAESLRRFVRAGAHLASAAEFEHDMRRPSIFVYYKLLGRDLPPSWNDAFARQREQDGRAHRAG
jgi:heme-degrading monooxygenase HmoA